LEKEDSPEYSPKPTVVDDDAAGDDSNMQMDNDDELDDY
jgi:hypothetical protein